MDCLGDQRTVRRQHEAAHLAVDGHIAHTLVAKDRVVDFPDAFADHGYVVGRVIWGVGNSDAARKVDEGDMHVKCAVNFRHQFKQLRRQHGIILVGHGITGQEGMDAKVLDALLLEDPHALEKLLLGKSVFGVAGVVHDAVGHSEHAAGIVAKTHGLRELAVQDLL